VDERLKIHSLVLAATWQTKRRRRFLWQLGGTRSNKLPGGEIWFDY
jgi:hypothetical protein